VTPGAVRLSGGGDPGLMHRPLRKCQGGGTSTIVPLVPISDVEIVAVELGRVDDGLYAERQLPRKRPD